MSNEGFFFSLYMIVWKYTVKFLIDTIRKLFGWNTLSRSTMVQSMSLSFRELGAVPVHRVHLLIRDIKNPKYTHSSQLQQQQQFAVDMHEMHSEFHKMDTDFSFFLHYTCKASIPRTLTWTLSLLNPSANTSGKRILVPREETVNRQSAWADENVCTRHSWRSKNRTKECPDNHKL